MTTFRAALKANDTSGIQASISQLSAAQTFLSTAQTNVGALLGLAILAVVLLVAIFGVLIYAFFLKPATVVPDKTPESMLLMQQQLQELARTMREQMIKSPDRIIFEAVKGMMPKTKLGRAQMKKLRIYAGNEHPHEAQQPKPLSFEGAK